VRLLDHRPGNAPVVLVGGREIELVLSVPGDHMLLNAVAALAAGVELGVDAQLMADGLAAYTGVRRRFEHKGAVGGITVYDDYAHHPTEVAAQIAAARGVLDIGAGDPSAARRRLVVVFQPHLYSRTETFADAFGVAVDELKEHHHQEQPTDVGGHPGEEVHAEAEFADETRLREHPEQAKIPYRGAHRWAVSSAGTALAVFSMASSNVLSLNNPSSATRRLRSPGETTTVSGMAVLPNSPSHFSISFDSSVQSA
jgi:UDP-N-acetylmuramoylalanine-D-glutamate ligase